METSIKRLADGKYSPRVLRFCIISARINALNVLYGVSNYQDKFATLTARCFPADWFLLRNDPRIRRIAGYSFYSRALTNWKWSGGERKRRRDGQKRFTRSVKAQAKTYGQKDRRLWEERPGRQECSRAAVVGLIVIDPLGSLASLLTWSRRGYHLPTRAAPSYIHAVT